MPESTLLPQHNVGRFTQPILVTGQTYIIIKSHVPFIKIFYILVLIYHVHQKLLIKCLSAAYLEKNNNVNSDSDLKTML